MGRPGVRQGEESISNPDDTPDRDIPTRCLSRSRVIVTSSGTGREGRYWWRDLRSTLRTDEPWSLKDCGVS